MRWFDDHRCSPRTGGDERGAMKDDPGSRARENAGERDLSGIVVALRGAQRAAGHRMDGGWQPARVHVSVGEVREPALDPGRRRLDLTVFREDDEPGRVRPCGSRASPTNSPVLA